MTIINKELDYNFEELPSQFKQLQKEINKQKRNDNK